MTQDTNGTAMAVRDEQRSLVEAKQEEAGYAALAHVLGSGDLSLLTDEQRCGHYVRLCRSLGLNELSRPFDWIYFKDSQDGPEKLALYANQSCAAQLRRQHHMRIQITRREVVGELFVCEATAQTPDGREDVSSKYVPLTGKYGPFKGQALASAMMKAETGAKRRVTLSMIGLASPPDSEDAASWRPVIVDGRGQVIANPTEEQKALAADPRMARVIGEPVFEDVDVPDGGTVSQAVSTDELERPAPRPAVSLYCDANKWRAAYFGAVEDTALETAEGRRQFLSSYTANYSPALRTDSLKTFLAHASDAQAEQMVAMASQEAQAIRDEERDVGADPDAQSVALDDEAQHQADVEAELAREAAF